MELIVTRWIGMEATALLLGKYGEELSRRFPAAFLREAGKAVQQMPVCEDERAVRRSKACEVCRLGEGGILEALWTLTKRMGMGMEVDLRKIPVRQETIELCEYFDINPYCVCSKGSILAAAENGRSLAEELAKAGIPAVVIGRLTNGNDKILWNDGNKRFLDKPRRGEAKQPLGSLPAGIQERQT